MHATQTRDLTIPLNGHARAVLTLPAPLCPETLAGVERALPAVLQSLRRDLDQGGADAGEREYASWAGALEYASWTRRPPPAGARHAAAGR